MAKWHAATPSDSHGNPPVATSSRLTCTPQWFPIEIPKPSRIPGESSLDPSDLPPVSLLRAFDAAGRHGSFKAAAAFLHVTPSTISHQIADLERYLGVKLFERGAAAVRLTPAGAEMLTDVSAAFERLRQATARIRRGGQPVAARISANPFLAAEVLVPLIADFDQQFPGMSIDISATEQLQDPRDGSVDFCVRFGDGPWPGVDAEALYAVSAIAVAAPGAAQLPPRIDYPFRGQSAWQGWESRGGAPVSTSDSVRRFSDFAAAMRAAEQGVGVALAIWPVVQPLIAQERLQRLPAAPVPLGHLYLLSRPLSPAQHRLLAARRWLKRALRLAAGVPVDPD